MAFDNYNPGDIIRIQYEAGSNPGSTRLVIFRELTDLRHKGPGFSMVALLSPKSRYEGLGLTPLGYCTPPWVFAERHPGVPHESP